jgi:hypothetical protein
MKTSLRVIFDAAGLSTEFDIEDVSAVPIHGEYFKANWPDFISDPKILQAIKEYERNEIFVSYILNKRYSKSHVEVSLVLMSESTFNRSRNTK